MPIVKLDTEKSSLAVLQWLPITKRGSSRGELLAAFELFLVGLLSVFISVINCLCKNEKVNYWFCVLRNVQVFK